MVLVEVTTLANLALQVPRDHLVDLVDQVDQVDQVAQVAQVDLEGPLSQVDQELKVRNFNKKRNLCN